MASLTFPCSAADYEKSKKIGSGSFSQVWIARAKQSGSMVAIKIIDLENISTSFEDILQEVQTMRLAEDPNILHCRCSFVHTDQLWLVTELMDKGSCVRVMRLSKSGGFGDGLKEECASYILREVVKALVYLHNQGQIHRDLKAGNILLNSAGDVKLADFGVSGWTVARGKRVNSVNTFVGTPCYMAPEVLEQAGGYDLKADIWSLGITALELAKGYAPYASLTPMRVLIKTIEEDPPGLHSYPHAQQQRPDGPSFSDQFHDFCNKCLQKASKSRPRADELSKHALFKQCSRQAIVSQLLDHIASVGAEPEPEPDVAAAAAAELVGGSNNDTAVAVVAADHQTQSASNTPIAEDVYLSAGQQSAVQPDGCQKSAVITVASPVEGAQINIDNNSSNNSSSSSASSTTANIDTRGIVRESSSWVFDDDSTPATTPAAEQAADADK